jgi:NAD(P)-dependent dehydrogenase (short-subunit alcohol dehydrogenase family)
MRLNNKVAVVTGSSQGIGRGIAIGLAKAGANVTVNCNQNVDKANSVANEIRELGRQALVVKSEVSKKNDVDRMVKLTLREFGKIDILVSNAGILIPGCMEELKEEDWDRVIDVNLKGVFLSCQAVGRHMIDSKSGGSIINIASISAHTPEVNAGAYTSSKAGVIGLTRLLAIEWARYGIRVNAINPGPVMTPLQRKSYPSEELLKTRNSAVPLNRHGTPEEMAWLAVFLASDEASYITGAEINVDGGSSVSMFHLVHKLAQTHYEKNKS